MAIEMSEYFQMRRKLNLSFAESEAALGTQRVEQLAACRDSLTADDRARLTTAAGQRALEREQAKKGRGR